MIKIEDNEGRLSTIKGIFNTFAIKQMMNPVSVLLFCLLQCIMLLLLMFPPETISNYFNDVYFDCHRKLFAIMFQSYPRKSTNY